MLQAHTRTHSATVTASRGFFDAATLVGLPRNQRAHTFSGQSRAPPRSGDARIGCPVAAGQSSAQHGQVRRCSAVLSASKRFVEKDLEVSMAGRAFMITGANSGIGKATAMAIAKRVSSGGMLVQKLRTGNLQSERGRYDGTMVYAQHKRQQVVMTEQLAKTHTNIHFSVMHPGWVDTPAVANAMPDFHSSMKESLRTPEQGADTVVWLAVSEAAITNPSGRFYQDRKMVSTHLPLAWTHSSPLEEQKLVSLLEDLAKTFQPH